VLPVQKLVVSSLIELGKPAVDRVELRRGMIVLAQNGEGVGVVAAIVLDCASQEMTHMLLGQLPPTAVYRLIPLHLIAQIDGETVWLVIVCEEIESLPVHQPG
jgi:sporulation protein YlmC with PRC-barrel domain